MPVMNPYRMLGRIEAATQMLLTKYGLGLSQEAPSWPALLMALSSKVNPYDSSFCQHMAHASIGYIDQAGHLSMTQSQIDMEKALGQQEADYIIRKYPNGYAMVLLEDRDFIGDMEAERAMKKKETVRNLYLIMSIVVVVVLGLIIYNLPYFAEGRAFNRVKKAYEEGYSFEGEKMDYMNKYPEGRHLGEVYYLDMLYARDRGYDETIGMLEAADAYLRNFPDGEHAKQCLHVSDSIWDEEIRRYDEYAASSATPDGAKFVREMLRYMKKNRVRTIDVVGTPTLNLKDYDEYSPAIRQLCDMLYSEEAHEDLSDIVSIKDKVTPEEAKSWTGKIIDGLTAGFNNVFTRDLIEFQAVGEDAAERDTTHPLVKVGYQVDTQESLKGMPDIWTHSETDSRYLGYKRVLGHYLGISMTFDAQFSLPGSKETFTVTGAGDPGSTEINNIEPEDVYSTMCGRCTQLFAIDISNAFGLKEGVVPAEAYAEEDTPAADEYGAFDLDSVWQGY